MVNVSTKIVNIPPLHKEVQMLPSEGNQGCPMDKNKSPKSGMEGVDEV